MKCMIVVEKWVAGSEEKAYAHSPLALLSTGAMGATEAAAEAARDTADRTGASMISNLSSNVLSAYPRPNEPPTHAVTDRTEGE